MHILQDTGFQSACQKRQLISFLPHRPLHENNALGVYWYTLGSQKGCPKIGCMKCSLPTHQGWGFFCINVICFLQDYFPPKRLIFSKNRNTVIKSVSRTSDHAARSAGSAVTHSTSSWVTWALLPSGFGSLTRTWYSQPYTFWQKVPC